MKAYTFLASFVLLGLTTAYVGPCFNQADPDHGIGNYCYCQGDEMSLFVQAFATSMIPIPSATHPVDKSHALKRKNHRQIQIWTMSTKTVTELGGLDAT
ncbi:hypothetical protein GGS24DRAFT_504221 [Hypoxylon argillaceum]|nr:hypothetical protein GGS24DRAFT_504221 [Hypoxylon argillaceum]